MSEARVLIVEDALGIARALSRALSLAEGDHFNVEVCSSAEQALLSLQEAPFDLLITDLRLPAMSGLELLEWARSNQPQMRSILITAYGSPQVEEQVHRVANAYLPKPFRLSDLLRLAHVVLSEPQQAQPSSAPQSLVVEEEMPPEAEISGRLHFTVLATDLDGTLAEDGRVDPETWEALRRLKASGYTIILVTGRVLETFAAGGPFSELCEAIVAENGAIVYFPRRDAIVFPFGRLTPEVLQRLHLLDAPLERGMAIVSTVVPHDAAILNLLREVGGGATVEYNRGSVMVLPLGATKGTGLKYALTELGFSPHNVVACGNAENDRSLFEVAEYAAAVSDAPDGVKALADAILPYPDGRGVRVLLNRLLNGWLPSYRSRHYRRLTLGNDLQGDPLQVDPFSLLNANLGIFGASSSGKSWLAGLLAEELLRQGYQVCIIDPEGDYRALATGPHILLLGGADRWLPSVADVFGFLESGQASLILDLSAYEFEERAYYLYDLLKVVEGLRARRGRPHWFLLDEAQYFCLEPDDPLGDLLYEVMQSGGFGVVSYRPGLIAERFLDMINQCLLTRMEDEEDLGVIRPFLESLPEGAATAECLPDLPVGQAYWCVGADGQPVQHVPGVTRFKVGPRSVPHIRHLHKYLRAPLPAAKRFYFHDRSGSYLGRAAANLWEFSEALAELPLESLEYHLQRADFQHWVEGVLRDEELARRIGKVYDRLPHGSEMRRALQEVVATRYEELANS